MKWGHLVPYSKLGVSSEALTRGFQPKAWHPPDKQQFYYFISISFYLVKCQYKLQDKVNWNN